MNIMGIAIGATGLLLLLMFLWMLAHSYQQKRLEQERRQREVAYRKALERDRKQEEQLRISKAENGDLGMILYLAKEAERNHLRKALYWYNKAALLDSVTGMYGIIRISTRMRDDMVLREQSKYWKIAIAAMDGDLNAKVQMAEALYFGRGVEQNIDKGYRLMEEAALQQYIPAMLFLGDWMIAPENPNPSPQASTEWYRKAALLRNNEGRMKLGMNYVHGIGVEEDFSQGCYWLERAAEKGYTPAMYKAGEVWLGHGLRGRSVAYIWLFLAGQMGHEEARVLREQVALNLSVDTVVGLQSLSKPMLKRIMDNKVGKHALIKALNKLYKRDIDYTLYDPSTVLDAEAPEHEVLQDEQGSQYGHVQEATTATATTASTTSNAPLNFSHSPMDKLAP
ncbi:tetratricopeptide repeat protein [Vibrio renipiscarius]|uniref:TPR repeat protein SEL1 subfamily n=1 Tax=Vibrio renipiscarius TaxID=1461322 RepID=A0A0C2NIU6_9VIBR|nr:tetratricopeptide repeat protein [Vibrio renipiscarius]KII76290.1 TPR repeat protein SEL1 subfamily [Vibrio renipiscarius]KII78188.1 TPR repeat protein SEL1 subfamily [Vibrio renipiscarius]